MANRAAKVQQHELWIVLVAWAVVGVLVARYLENHKAHIIQNASTELWLGVGLYVVGSILLWDTFVQRGRSAPWPLGMATPF
jgi:hypothetical protein